MTRDDYLMLESVIKQKLAEMNDVSFASISVFDQGRRLELTVTCKGFPRHSFGVRFRHDDRPITDDDKIKAAHQLVDAVTQRFQLVCKE